jgi:hypothetical protein
MAKHQKASGTISKMEAVRRALREGVEAPGDIADFAQTQFGLQIKRDQISAYKSQIRSKERQGQQSSRARRERPNLDPVAAARAVKEVVDRFGADTVKGLVDLFKG